MAFYGHRNSWEWSEYRMADYSINILEKPFLQQLLFSTGASWFWFFHVKLWSLKLEPASKGLKNGEIFWFSDFYQGRINWRLPSMGKIVTTTATTTTTMTLTTTSRHKFGRFFRQILISRHFLVQSMNGEISREVPTTLWLEFFLSVCLSDVAKRNIFRNNCCQCCQITVTESSLALLTKIKRTIRVEIKNVENFLNQLVETKSSWDPLGPIFFLRTFSRTFSGGTFHANFWFSSHQGPKIEKPGISEGASITFGKTPPA